MPRVFNKRNLYPQDAIYIGRPSKWGNPFLIGRDGTRTEVIERFRLYLTQNYSLSKDIQELRGKNLVCFCSPLPCHGDILLELANK